MKNPNPEKSAAHCSREARARQRMLAGSGSMPPFIAVRYTQGQAAVLCVVADEARKNGLCDMPLDKLAASAGVSQATVRNALCEARRLGHVKYSKRPRPGWKTIGVFIQITSTSWQDWIRKWPEELCDGF